MDLHCFMFAISAFYKGGPWEGAMEYCRCDGCHRIIN